MTSNFWRHCAISALKISKNHFATFDFFVKMKLVSTMWVSTSLSKSGYLEVLHIKRIKEPEVETCPIEIGHLLYVYSRITLCAIVVIVLLNGVHLLLRHSVCTYIIYAYMSKQCNYYYIWILCWR